MTFESLKLVQMNAVRARLCFWSCATKQVICYKQPIKIRLHWDLSSTIDYTVVRYWRPNCTYLKNFQISEFISVYNVYTLIRINKWGKQYHGPKNPQDNVILSHSALQLRELREFYNNKNKHFPHEPQLSISTTFSDVIQLQFTMEVYEIQLAVVELS